MGEAAEGMRDAARTMSESAGDAGRLVDEALRAAVGAPSGVGFVDVPMDHAFAMSDDDGQPGALTAMPPTPTPDAQGLERAASLLSAARRPVIMAGTNVWWGHGEAALLRLAEELQIPALLNGMARGAVPADHPMAFSRVRGKALGEADVALIVGVPMDFRLGFGKVFGPQTQLIVADRGEPVREHPRPIAAGLYGDVRHRIELQRNLPRLGPMDLVQCEFHSDGHTQHWRGDYLQQFQDSERRERDRYH